MLSFPITSVVSLDPLGLVRINIQTVKKVCTLVILVKNDTVHTLSPRWTWHMMGYLVLEVAPKLDGPIPSSTTSTPPMLPRWSLTDPRRSTLESEQRQVKYRGSVLHFTTLAYLDVFVLGKEEEHPCGRGGRRVLPRQQQTDQHASDLVVGQVTTRPVTFNTQHAFRFVVHQVAFLLSFPIIKISKCFPTTWSGPLLQILGYTSRTTSDCHMHSWMRISVYASRILALLDADRWHRTKQDLTSRDGCTPLTGLVVSNPHRYDAITHALFANSLLRKPQNVFKYVWIQELKTVQPRTDGQRERTQVDEWSLLVGWVEKCLQHIFLHVPRFPSFLYRLKELLL